ncbi:hypothetical protein ASD11_07325 [Aeromicrobium sp. Root495]|uniref:hypothetical protein n=1 Tax=Aeromicrobium sp. Root495 TaxID=1736550 RepID=UPI0006F7FC27|nr:hypothetical protein [Aeromicrobium sp. Root495]KQY59372.1 hypothetical protein ASD11_07325 [Aeromicrobium sp. Root495]
MSTTSIAYDILARDRGASASLTRIGDAAERAGVRTNRAGKLVKGGALAMSAGIGSATLVALRFAKAAASDELMATKMARAFKNNAGATRLQISATEAWITKQGLALGVTDDELRPALGRLVTATNDVGEAQRLASLAMNVSAGRGKALGTVTEALARAQGGNTSALSRLGVVTKDASGKALTFDQITQNLAKTFKGQAAGAADTTAGKYARVKIAFSEAGEALGYKLMGPLTEMATWLTGTGIPVLDKWSSAVGEKVGAASDTVRDKVGTILDTFRGLQDLDGEEIGTKLAGAVESGLGKLGGLAGSLYERLDQAFGDVDWLGLGIGMGKQVPSLLLGLATGIVTFDFGSLLSGVGEHWQEVLMGVLLVVFAPAKIAGGVARSLERIPLAGKLLGWVVRSLNGAGGKVKGKIVEWFKWFSDGFFAGLGRTGPGILSRFGSFMRRIPATIVNTLRAGAGRADNAMYALLLRMADGASSGVLRVVRVVRALPGKAIKALSGFGGKMAEAGRDAVRGLVSGLTDIDLLGRISGAARALGDRVPGSIKKLLRIKSPSRVMMEIGGYVTEGLAKGILGPKTKSLDAAVARTVAKVRSIREKLAGLRGERNTFAAGMNFSSSVFGGDYGELGPSTGGILAYQQRQLDQANQVKGDVSKLLRLGLSASLIRQMQASGESGIAAMHQLATTGSRADVSQLNALDKATQVAYGRTGAAAGGAVFNPAIKRTKGELTGAEKLLRVLERLDKNTGKAEIHIHLEGKDILYSINKHNRRNGKK